MKFEVQIKNLEPLSYMELQEIIGTIDWEIVRGHFGEGVYRDLRQRYRGKLPFSFVEIAEVKPGSIILTALVTGSIVWTLVHLRRGVNSSPLGNEIERSGKLLGTVAASILRQINDRLEVLYQDNLRLRGRDTRATIVIPDQNDEQDTSGG